MALTFAHKAFIDIMPLLSTSILSYLSLTFINDSSDSSDSDDST